MGKFNEQLVKAGVMLAAEGLQASSKGARVKFSGSNRTVIDGPFTETISQEPICHHFALIIKIRAIALSSQIVSVL